MPLPGTRVVHPRFAAHHATTDQSGMTATCTITRATAGSNGPGFTWTDGTPTDVAVDIACRVTPAIGQPRHAHSPEALDVVSHDYTIAVPHGTPAVHVDDVVTVTASTGPLTGAVFRVVDVVVAAEAWSQLLLCRRDITTTE